MYLSDDAPPPRVAESPGSEPARATDAPYAHYYSAHSLKGLGPFAYIGIAIVLLAVVLVTVYALYACYGSAKRSEERHQQIKKLKSLAKPGAKSKVSRWRWAKQRDTDDSRMACLERSDSLSEKRMSTSSVSVDSCVSPLAPSAATFLPGLQLPPRMFDVHKSPRTCDTNEAQRKHDANESARAYDANEIPFVSPPTVDTSDDTVGHNTKLSPVVGSAPAARSALVQPVRAPVVGSARGTDRGRPSTTSISDKEVPTLRYNAKSGTGVRRKVVPGKENRP
ncbi:hypothetical protein BD626DRAFT_394048 [Schizophyllum amplum]|uniref:Transmembrane protein n=1 Tax=Schizophyllum amplum TaxID=97359 RepID=A0A550CVD5_9AGAR|nr:hypothetical protein BD626DRAFT_394048 [Auriculariopsis ampla]